MPETELTDDDVPATLEAPTDDYPEAGDPISSLLADAEAMLRRDGWCQAVIFDPASAAMCLLGALTRARSLQDIPVGQRHADVRAACARLRQVTGSRSPIIWNDQPGRRVEDVYAVLQEARRR